MASKYATRVAWGIEPTLNTYSKYLRKRIANAVDTAYYADDLDLKAPDIIVHKDSEELSEYDAPPDWLIEEGFKARNRRKH